ncbi:cytochrome c biogenesis FC [Trifolium repens]|nr:cytochrome c biogenesis FC [Trifolium repens]
MGCSGHPDLERMVEGFGHVAFPVPPSSGGACVGGVPPKSEIGLDALALPTSRQLMAVGHDYHQKAPMKMNRQCYLFECCLSACLTVKAVDLNPTSGKIPIKSTNACFSLLIHNHNIYRFES